MVKKSPKHLKVVKVFIGSPRDLNPERRLFRDAIEKVNEIKAKNQGLLLEAVGWEDTLLGKGRPQKKINTDLRQCDLVIMLLWKRWGSATGKYSSGFEEEYEVARSQKKEIFFYFKSIPIDMLADQGEQLQQVTAFRKKIEADKGYLFRPYEDTDKWRDQFERDLCNWLDDLPPEELDISALQEKARKFDEFSDKINELDVDKRQLAKRYIDLAWKHADTGNQTEAEEEFVKALELSRSPRAINEYGLFLSRIGLLDKAGEIFQELQEIGEAADDRTAIVCAYNNLGLIYDTQGKLEKAEGMYRQLLALSEELGRKKGMATAYGNLGVIYKTRGELEKAEEMYRQSLALSEEMGWKEGMATSYGNLGIIYKTRGELEKAEGMYHQSLALNEELGRKEGMADDYGNLGVIYQIRRKPEKAEMMHRQSLALDEELGRKEGIANSYGNLSTIYLNRGELEKAEEMCRQSLASNEELCRKEGMADSYGILGNIYNAQGELEKAKEMYHLSLALNQELGRRAGMAIIYGNLGLIYEAQGDVGEAENLSFKARDLFAEVGMQIELAQVEKILEDLRNPDA